ncbi:MAG: hypothetical protein FWC52_02870 [Candidatus Methanoplasma sp.]|nr:hypothetical protein [Candidatus Methanoplasma sp.]
MPFFDDNKNVGLLLILLGLLTILAGIVLIATVGGRSVAGAIIGALGLIICGLFYLIAGMNIRESGEKIKGVIPVVGGIVGLKIVYDNKIGVMTLVLMVMGAAMVVSAVFTLISYAVWGFLGGAAAVPVILIIVGIFLVYTSTVISGDRKSSSSSLLWIILLILLLISIIFAIMSFAVVVGFFNAAYVVFMVLSALISLVIYLYLLLMTLSPEVKTIMDVK